MNTTSTSGVPTLAKPKQRSTSSTTAAHRPPPRAESTTTTSTESTLSTIRSPSSNHQKQALLQMPVMTQAVKLPMRFRRGKSQVKDIDWTFKSVSDLVAIVLERGLCGGCASLEQTTTRLSVSQQDALSQRYSGKLEWWHRSRLKRDCLATLVLGARCVSGHCRSCRVRKADSAPSPPPAQVFHKVEYKGRQQEIMEASLLGSDILVIAPTGMGKSLCFQVPAVAETHGLTLVVSPLLCETLPRSSRISTAYS